MTLIESGPVGTFPPRALLESAPFGSRVVLRYAAGVRSVYRKAGDGLWYGVQIIAASPHRTLTRTPLPGALSSQVFDVFDREQWSLHHPGIMFVGIEARHRGGARYWWCSVCHDAKESFDSIPEAADDARAHVRNHAEAVV